MNPLRTTLLTVGLLFAFDGVAREPIPIQALAHAPAIQSVSMSADGKNVVALTAAGADSNDTNLATWNLDTPDAPPTVTASGNEMKFIFASALKADRVLVVARQEWTGRLGGCGEGKVHGATKTFVTKAYLTDTRHKDFDEAFASNTRSVGVSEETQRCLELGGRASLVSQLPLDPDNVIIQQLNEQSLEAHYHLYNLRTNKTKLLFRANERSSAGLFNPRNGELLTKVQLEPAGGDEYEMRTLIKNASTGEFEIHDKLTAKLSERHNIDVVGLDEASGKFYVLTDQFSDLVQARMYDPARREFDPEPLLAHPQFSIMGITLGTRQSDFNKVIAFTVGAMEPTVEYVDADLRSIHEALAKMYKDRTVEITGYNDDRSRVLFTTSSHRHSPAYHVLIDRKRVLNFGQERSDVNPDDIGEQRWVTYKARDGMTIPAILDLPAGWTKEQGPLPTVIHPHGGPWARDFGGWDGSGWVPFLTSRGYAVLRPQYRGSSGVGRSLWLAGDSEWGQKMQDDKDDGAAWLVEQGITDPKRMVIFGYSYGGFAAAAAAVRPNSPYQCAISGAPVTDLGRLGTSWSDNRIQRIQQGRTVTGMDPMRNTDKANIPVLLYVGDRDVRTPSFHAKNFYDAIKGKVHAEFELIPDMPHSMPWYPRHQVKALGLMEKFLAGPCAGK